MPMIKEKKMLNFTDQEEKTNEHIDKWLEMFALFIHDMESPLASMKYLLKLLETKKFDYQKPLHQKLVSSTKIALKRSESTIYDIMAIAKAGKIGLPVSLTQLNVEESIKEAILMITPSAEERNISISYNCNAKNVLVKADQKLLNRTLDNLLYNALRHTPSEKNINVYTETEQQSLYIHIKDSGDGLGNIELEKLFEKYGQLELRTQGKHRGVGLGLYFCKLAATAMGGTIIADDHPEGGAVFTIRLQKIEGNKNE